MLFVARSYITQATIESLEKATEKNPRHPMRQAFGDNYQPIRNAMVGMHQRRYPLVQIALEHLAKMRQFAAPEFLRRLVAQGVQNNMPAGLVVQRVRLRAGTLAAMATGSDMIRVTFPELALQILGRTASIELKERVKDIFQRAEVASSAQILEELNVYLENMSVLTMQDNHAKMAMKRFVTRMTDIFNGTLPECPITMEQIPKERVRILQCCTCVIDADVIEQCKGVCPLCRAPITKVGAVNEHEPLAELEPPKEPLSDKAAGKRKAEPSASGSKQQKLALVSKPKRSGSPSLQELLASSDDEAPHEEDDDDEAEKQAAHAAQAAKLEVFNSTLAQISSDRPYSVDGILRIMKAQVELEPSSRILLCFAFGQDQRHVVGDIMNRIRNEIQGCSLSDIDAVARNYQKMDEAKMRFDNVSRFPEPQIFLINTPDTSHSVQGLDLYMTDLTIVADQCSLPTQRQAAGRSLRMRPRPPSMKKGELFQAKRIVIAQISAPAPAPNPPADEPFDPFDDEEPEQDEDDRAAGEAALVEWAEEEGLLAPGFPNPQPE